MNSEDKKIAELLATVRVYEFLDKYFYVTVVPALLLAFIIMVSVFTLLISGVKAIIKWSSLWI